MRWIVHAITIVLALHSFASARAQSVPSGGANEPFGRWMVLPAEVAVRDHEDSATLELLHGASGAIRRELALRGERVWSSDRATERFEAIGSAPAPEVSQRDIDRWVERSRAAVRYLARADYKAARRELKAAQGLADRAAEELNREAARAQQVLDTCLFMVRAYLETRDREEGRRQARECRQLVPRVEPSAFRHTPEVRDLLADVDAEIASEAPGRLEVASAPSACLVRINGVEFGRTPLAAIELPVGTYRVQVECDPAQRGRIHRVAIVSGANGFFVDGELDQVVRTRPILHLRYSSVDAWGARMTHASTVADVLDDASPLVVSALPGSMLRLDSNAPNLAPASAWIEITAGEVSADEIRHAVDAVLEGRSVDFTGPHPLARQSWGTTRTAAVDKPAVPSAMPAEGSVRSRPQRIAGWSLFGVGAASIAASVGLHVWRGNLGDTFIGNPANLNDAQRWNDARVAVWATAAVGGSAITGAMPLLLPKRERTPW